MKTRLVRIGNSRGVRIPKPLIEEAGLNEEVELRVRDGAIVIASAGGVRVGWAEAAQELHEQREDEQVIPSVPTRFEEEWEW
jgi:antitoxin MazE